MERRPAVDLHRGVDHPLVSLPLYLEAPPPAFVGSHQLDGQMLGVAKMDQRTGQLQAAHDPSGEEVTGPGVARDLQVMDVP